MMKNLLPSFIISSQLLTNLLLANANESHLPWKDRRAEGWAWYHDPKNVKEVKQEPQRDLDPKKNLEIVKGEIERSLAKAILEPNEENIANYITLQKKWIDQAQLFSTTWQKVILKNPELGYFYPTTQYGVQVDKSFHYKSIKNLISKLSKNYFLLFIYEGGNSYSQAFAAVVKAFSLENHWDLTSISIDGQFVRDLPDSKSDMNIAKEMNLTVFPALFAVESKSGKAIPLAFGLETISHIEENIMLQFEGIKND